MATWGAPPGSATARNGSSSPADSDIPVTPKSSDYRTLVGVDERPTIAQQVTVWSRVDAATRSQPSGDLRKRVKSRPARSRRVTSRPRHPHSPEGSGVGTDSRLLSERFRRSGAQPGGGGGNRTRPNRLDPSNCVACQHNPSGFVGTDRVPLGSAVDAVNSPDSGQASWCGRSPRPAGAASGASPGRWLDVVLPRSTQSGTETQVIASAAAPTSAVV